MSWSHATLQPVPWHRVRIRDAFWDGPVTRNREITLPAEHALLESTGRLGALLHTWRPGQPNKPHPFWESDIAKWIEAAAYSLATHPDAELEARVDAAVDLLAGAQQPDGYLNTYYTVVEPGKRWTNLRDMHELYCAGHLMEAAVAYHEATGKGRLLEIMARYTEHIASVFGPNEGQKRGYPGHEEIELALVRMYRATGEQRYLDLASFFIDERGRQPHYYDLEAKERGDDPAHFHGRTYAYNQSHLPVREQLTAEGHSVRAMYLYSGMVDVALETGDTSLLAACERLWRNVCERRMYVTGGIGSSAWGERFTFDYDLPPDIAYAETCAAIGLAFWAQRMIQAKGEAHYADVLERALYNGVLSGVSLDGRAFFYANPLEVYPPAYEGRPDQYSRGSQSPTRQEWFDCACCPPNLARLLSSLGGYIYSTAPGAAYVHLYIGGHAEMEVDGRPLSLQMNTRYPWEGDVRLTVQPAAEQELTLALRLPGWAREATLRVNGEAESVEASSGYARVTRTWRPGDVVELSLPLPIERIEAHPAARHCAGQVALQRGPLVYCVEEVDAGANLADIVLPLDADLEATFEADLLGGVVALRGRAERRDAGEWENTLYRRGPSARQPVPIQAVPYYAWGNRGPGEMRVWLHAR